MVIFHYKSTYRRQKTVFSIIKLKFLYPEQKKWDTKFISALKALIEECEKDISLKHIGLPDDWEERIRNI